ncbi:MAG TPA: SRPBCC family protein [Acidimicrobiales bacterium]
MTETLDSTNGRSVLRIERRLDHPPARVWRAVTQPEHLAQWFPAAVSFDGRLAPGVAVAFDMGDGPVLDGVVTAVEPPRTLAFTWGDDHLRFDLAPDGDGCRLVLTHTFDDRAGAASFAAGWDRCLAALDRVAGGRVPAIESPSAALHERYARQFGLTVGEADDTPEGWAVRFERQLTRPAADVWSLLTGAPAAPAVGGPVPPRACAGVDAGRVTAVEAPTLLEFTWRSDERDAGRVRWELGHEGTGHGARLVVVQTGLAGDDAARAAALAGWVAPIDALAAELAAAGR